MPVKCMIFGDRKKTKALYRKYRNVPKFSDRQVWANSADPDQIIFI